MIIHYDKNTGRIIQTVQDRIHNPKLESKKPNVSIPGVEIETLVIKFVPQGENMPYKPEVSPDQEELVYQFERLGDIKEFKIVDGKILKEQPMETSLAQTIIIDLRKTEEEIFNGFSKDVQQEIKKAESSGLVLKLGTYNDGEKLEGLVKQMGDVKGQPMSVSNYFEDLPMFVRAGILLYFVEDKSGNTLGGCLIYPSKIPQYRAAATTPKGREVFAGFFMIWNVIKELKKLGFEALDLGGIYYNENTDTSITEDKKNINHYKGKFGGVNVTLKDIKLYRSKLTSLDQMIKKMSSNP